MLTESYLYESDKTRKTKYTLKNNKTTPNQKRQPLILLLTA